MLVILVDMVLVESEKQLHLQPRKQHFNNRTTHVLAGDPHTASWSNLYPTHLELDLLQCRAAGLGQQAAAQSDGTLLGAWGSEGGGGDNRAQRRR